MSETKDGMYGYLKEKLSSERKEDVILRGKDKALFDEFEKLYYLSQRLPTDYESLREMNLPALNLKGISGDLRNFGKYFKVGETPRHPELDLWEAIAYRRTTPLRVNGGYMIQVLIDDVIYKKRWMVSIISRESGDYEVRV